MTISSTSMPLLNNETSGACCMPKKCTLNSRESISARKYYLFFFNLLTWKHPRLSGSVLGGLIALLLFSTTVDFPRLILRTAWIVFASSTVIEVIGRVLFKQPNGFISQFAPSSFYLISRESLNNLADKICEVTNFTLYSIQELLFAKKLKHTAIAFIVSWTSFVLIQFFSFVHVLLLGIVFAFTIPLFYIKYQNILDKYFKYISTLANKYFYLAKNQCGKYAAQIVKRLFSDFVKLNTKLNHDINKFKNGFKKNKASLSFIIKSKLGGIPSKKVSNMTVNSEKLTEGIETSETSVPITS